MTMQNKDFNPKVGYLPEQEVIVECSDCLRRFLIREVTKEGNRFKIVIEPKCECNVEEVIE